MIGVACAALVTLAVATAPPAAAAAASSPAPAMASSAAPGTARSPAPAVASSAAPEPAASADTARLRRELEQLAAAHRGVTGISVKNLATGETLSIRGHEAFPSASLIKVPILVTVMDEVQHGRMRLDERISLISRDRVGGSGILKHMQSGLAPTLEDLAWLMITLSDNTATNLILDRIDVRTVWTKMEALGLPHSKVHSKTFRRETSIAPDSSVLYGLGVTTPDEIVRLFELLHHGHAVSPALDSLAMRMLFANQDDALLTRWLPGDARVAHKSGAVDRARNDCGILYTPAAPVALCVMTRENENTSYALDHPAYLLVAGAARAVFAHYNPDVALPQLPALMPGTGR